MDIEKIWTPIQTILAHPGAIEKEYVRMKSRLSSLENCRKIFPNFMKLYGLWFLRRLKTRQILRALKESNEAPEETLRRHVEEERRMDELTGFDFESIIQTTSRIKLREYYKTNGCFPFLADYDLSLDDLFEWIDDNKEVVAEAVAHDACQSLPHPNKAVHGIEVFCNGDGHNGVDYMWLSETSMLSEIKKLIPAAKSECRADFEFIFKSKNESCPSCGRG